MAKTYFKAQPTAAETQINWAEVGKNFSDMLTEEARVREEKKAAIDEASRQYQQTLNDVEQGQSATANQWWLNAAGEMQQQMLMQDRMLKSGMLNPRDYTVMRQNLVDGTDGLIGVFDKFNAEFEDRMNRFENGESQDLEQWAMAELENFGNFQKTSVVVNPETGMLSVADVDDDGNIINDPNKVRSVTSLQNLIARRYDKFDVDAAAATFVDGVGTFDKIDRTIGTQYRKGLIKKLSDPFMKEFTPEELMALGMTEEDAINSAAELNIYKAGEDQLVSDIMSVWSNTSSILTNTMSFAPNGEEYTFTFEEEGRAENEILLKKDGQGQIYAVYTKEQEKAVSDAIRDNVRNRLDREVEVTTSSDFQFEPVSLVQDRRGREEKINREANIYTNVADLYGGDEAKVDTAIQFLRGINPNIDNIIRNKDGVTVAYADGSFESLDFEDMNQADWSGSSVNFFLPSSMTEFDVNAAQERSGITGTGAEAPRDFGAEATFSNAKTQKQVVYDMTLDEAFEKGVTEEIRSITSAGKNAVFDPLEDTTASQLESLVKTVFPGMPFTVEIISPGYDEVELRLDGTLLKTFYLDGLTSSKEVEYDKWLRNNLPFYANRYYSDDTKTNRHGDIYEASKREISVQLGQPVNVQSGQGDRSASGGTSR
jgi:hypothetical protein